MVSTCPFIAHNELMSPLHDLLKSWDQTLQTAFKESKSSLCDLALKGFTSYDLTKDTVLVTDWSKVGIGFVLLQKHCSCATRSDPLCCDGGWKPVYCNSRTLVPEEAGYAPIEGEDLGVRWAVKKAHLFLLGHPNSQYMLTTIPL